MIRSVQRRSLASCLIGLLLLAAASGCGLVAPHNRQDGVVTVNDARTFCIGLPAATGFCGPHAWAVGRHLAGLPLGACVRVSYSGGQASTTSVADVSRLVGCNQPTPTPQ